MLKAGIIGAGMIASPLSEALFHIDEVEFCYIYNRTREKAKPLSELYHLKIADTPEELIENVDVVVIAVATPYHFKFAKMAIEKNKHIFCEKPLTLTLKEAYELRKLLKGKYIKFGVGHVVRFFPEYLKFKKIIETKDIGDVVNVRLERLGPPPWSSWFFDEGQSGGIIQDLLIHDLDFAQWVFGPPSKIKAVMAKNKRHAQILLEFEGGIIVHIEGSWAFPTEIYPFNYGFEAVGTGGILRYNSLDRAPYRVYKEREVEYPMFLFKSPYEKELSAFIKAILNDQDPPVKIEDGILALELVYKVKEALDE